MAPNPDGKVNLLPKWIRLDLDRAYVNVSADDQKSLTGLFAFEVTATLDAFGKLFKHVEQFRVIFANEIDLPLFVPQDPEATDEST